MDTAGTSHSATAVDGFQPLGFGNLLERVFQLCWHERRTFGAIVGILVVPAALVFYSSFLAFPWEIIPAAPRGEDIFAQAPGTDVPLERWIAFGALLVLGGVLSFIGAMAATGASINAAQRAYAGLPVAATGAIRLGLRRAPSLLWVMFVGAALVVAIFLFILAPGVLPLVGAGWSDGLPNVDVTSVLLFILMLLIAMTVAGLLWLMWILAPVVVMCEPRRGTKALRRSFWLVRGKVFWIGAVVFVAFVAQWTIASVFTIPAALVPLEPSVEGFRAMLLAQLFLGILPTFMYIPLQATVNALLYVDARVRKEGLTRAAFEAELQDLSAS